VFQFESTMSANGHARVRWFSCSTWEGYSYQSGIKEGSKTCILSSCWEISAFSSVDILQSNDWRQILLR